MVKGTSEQGPEGAKQVNCTYISGKGVSTRNGKCKGPEAGVHLGYEGHPKKTGVASLEGRRREGQR